VLCEEDGEGEQGSDSAELKEAREAVSEDTSTEPVTAPDLLVGDVIKGTDGHYYAVDTRPEPSQERQEYPVPHIALRVTEMNGDMSQVTNSEKRVILSQDAVLDVLTPRPKN
jgi:hypothetical protein